jgi:RNA polymerase sigma factor (sigma-70 family)
MFEPAVPPTDQRGQMKPILASTASSAASDEQLVAAARTGSDEAVEALFRRYRERITAYARGIVVDPGRAEDIVQETFMSALRSLRATEREIVFKPWIYQIAKNACIDQLRRQGRAEEISIDSDDFKPQHEGRLSQATPTTHKAVSQREDMHQLAQAFGGLPRSQHDVLVLRELEGRSYEEIARRLDTSRSAVESMLFRARRGLKDEYDEIATGQRCRRTHALIAAVLEGLGTARDRRAIARHTRLCAGCRHEAFVHGLGSLVSDGKRRGKVRSAIDRAAALLPFPFLRRRSGGPEASSAGIGSRAQNVISNLGSLAGPGAEQTALLPKAVAAVVATVVIAGGGIVGESSPSATGSSQAPAAASPGIGSLAGTPGLPGQPSGPGAVSGSSGAPGLLGGLIQGSEQSAAALFSPSLLPPSVTGPAGTGQGGGLIGGLAAPGGGTGAPGSGLKLPSVGGIQLPGASAGGGGGSQNGSPIDQATSGLGNTQLPRLDTTKVPKTPSLPTPSQPKPPSVSTPSPPSSGSGGPSLPSTPSTPSVPSASSTIGSATGTVGGVTGAVGSVEGTTGSSLPQVPGLP